MAETLTPGLIAGRPEDVPWYGGSEALREKELIGDPQQNPKVAQYVDALGEQDRIYSAIGKKERLKGQEIYDPRDREGNILYEKPRSLYKKRYEEMKEKFPGYSNEEIDEILAYYETSQPKVGMSYGELGKMFDTGDKQAYYADNFRMEKAQGGIMNLKKKW